MAYTHLVDSWNRIPGTKSGRRAREWQGEREREQERESEREREREREREARRQTETHREKTERGL